jgi:hypothetical protein
MSAEYSKKHEREPKREDAVQLATLLYYSIDRDSKTREVEIGEVVADIKSYIQFRAKQDSEMGQEIVGALESFRDPDATLATLEAARDMQQVANGIREGLGLPAVDLPTTLPPHGDH